MRKTYLSETALGLIAAIIFGSVAFADGPTNDPRAEVFRAAGCDAEWLRPVTNAAGEVLYWTNTDGKGCGPARDSSNGGEFIGKLIEVLIENRNAETGSGEESCKGDCK